ncbi:MAG: hemolysin-type calcium binding domain protein [Rhodocyclales bacterium]|nr:hemolysin-type calcium binding domain protein [Rhodocyclales bacterium]
MAGKSLKGTSGNDTIYGTTGSDTLSGLGGNDYLYGDGGNDTLDGGAGNDFLYGGTGKNTYLFGRGSGADKINSGLYSSQISTSDIVQLGANIAKTDIEVRRIETVTYVGGEPIVTHDLQISIKGTTDKIIWGAYFDTPAGAGTVKFSDGSSLSYSALSSLAIAGSTGNDYLYGSVASETIAGGPGNDTLYGGGGKDVFDGGAGNDFIYGQAQSTYLFGKGGGADELSYTTYQVPAYPGTSVVKFGAGVSESQLWLQRVTNSSHSSDDLKVSIIGTNDSFTIDNWFGISGSGTGTSTQIDHLEVANGKHLLASQVDNLVNAMAAFAPPAAGQTTLPPSYQSQLNPVIAANWK